MRGKLTPYYLLYAINTRHLLVEFISFFPTMDKQQEREEEEEEDIPDDELLRVVEHLERTGQQSCGGA